MKLRVAVQDVGDWSLVSVDGTFTVLGWCRRDPAGWTFRAALDGAWRGPCTREEAVRGCVWYHFGDNVADACSLTPRPCLTVEKTSA